MVSARCFHSAAPGPGWEDGLAVGNGTVGALVYGTPERHLVTVAHERVVLPTDPIRRAPDLAADLTGIRALIDGGAAQAAAELGVARAAEQGYPGLQWTDPLVPAASLVIIGPPAGENYRRDVDLDGIVTISWEYAGRGHRIRVLVSRADPVTVVELTGFANAADTIRLEPPGNLGPADGPGIRGGNAEHVSFNRPEPAAGELTVLRLAFRADWDFDPTGATTRLVVLSQSTDVTTLVLRVAPDFGGTDGADGADVRAMGRPENADFDALAARHRQIVAGVPRVELDLDTAVSGLSTESLLASADPDHQRELLTLQMGAAQALIAGSTGELPPTLQGVWSGTYDPAWSSDYTMNGNVQNGSIAGMLPTGNAEQLDTWLRMLEGFADDFVDNSARLFGTDGYVLPSRCSPTHGRTTHFDAQHCHEFWTAGGAWAAAFFFDRCWYSGDLGFLAERAYPFGRQIEEFYAQFLSTDADGTLVFDPSYSPENSSPTFASQACRNATMDRASLARLLHDLLQAAEILGRDTWLIGRRQAWLAALPPYRIAPDGTLAEWLDHGVVENLGHRTSSALFGWWFSPDPDLLARPELADATRALVERKLAWRAQTPGAEEMAYGLVQLGLAACAIGDRHGAAECLRRLSRLYFRPALTTTHDVGAIFNVDIAGGLPALVCAMLANSSGNEVRVLPALPVDWPTGRVTGIHLRGGLVVTELRWTTEQIDLVLAVAPGRDNLFRGRGFRILFPPGFRAEQASGVVGGPSQRWTFSACADRKPAGASMGERTEPGHD